MLNIIWKAAEGTQQQKPAEVDTSSSPFTVYLRKDIQQLTKADPQGGASIPYWSYQEAQLSLKEYVEYQAQEAQCETLAQKQLREENLVVMAAVADSFEKQLALEENQLTIMGAIAELFENTNQEGVTV